MTTDTQAGLSPIERSALGEIAAAARKLEAESEASVRQAA